MAFVKRYSAFFLEIKVQIKRLIMVIIRYSNFGAKSLPASFFNVANFESYKSFSEYWLLNDQKLNKACLVLIL